MEDLTFCADDNYLWRLTCEKSKDMHDRRAVKTMPTHISTTQQQDKKTHIYQADRSTSDLYEGIAPSCQIPLETSDASAEGTL